MSAQPLANTHIHACAHTRAHTHIHTHTQTHRHTDTNTRVTLQHTNMCHLALNLQHSCLFGLHQPAPSPSHTIVSPHHCPPTFASLPPCILPAPTLSPHSTITATWHYHLTILHHRCLHPHHPICPSSPHTVVPRHPCYQPSLSCTTDLSVVVQRPHCTVALPPSSPSAALCHLNTTTPHTSPPCTTISTPWDLRPAPLLPPSSCHLAPSTYPSSSFSPCTVTTPHQPPHTFHAL